MDSTDIVLTEELQEQYLNSLEEAGRKAQTIHIYHKFLEELYEFLPEDKVITKEGLEDWRSYLKEKQYSDRTINIHLTAANGLLKYCGKDEYKTTYEKVIYDEDMPEMTRAEYLQFLSDVYRLGTEQEYLLIKVFGSIDIRMQELEYLTVEACLDGMIQMPDGRICRIPDSLKHEILQYAKRSSIQEGMIFATRSGKPLDRSNIAKNIKNLAAEAGMEAEKCNPTALHRMYRTTQEKIKEMILPIYLKTYDNLLNTEQALITKIG